MHSQEPWSSDEDGYVYDARGESHGQIRVEDATRIVACVNACAGISACDLPRVRALWDRHLGFDVHQTAGPYGLPMVQNGELSNEGLKDVAFGAWPTVKKEQA